MTTQHFKQLVNKFNWEGNYQIWIASAESSKFTLIEGIEEETVLPFQHLSFQTEQANLIIENDKTFLLFTYPNHYQIILNVYERKAFTEGELTVIYHYLYPYYTNAIIEREKYKLEKMIESTGRASASLNPEEIYKNILSYAMDVIPNCDIGTLWWMDATSEKLICKASSGKILKGIRSMQFRLGEGPIGYTFQTGIPLLVNPQKQKDLQNMGSISSENEQYWDSSYEFLVHVKSFLTYPIKVDDKIEGVMFLCQITKPNELSDDDLHLLKGFSSQVGIAIRNARQYSHIKSLNDLLVKRDHIHTTLSKLSMQNLGMMKIVEEMSRMTNKELLFVDLLENILTPITKKLPNNLTFKDLNEILQEHNGHDFYELKRSGYVTHLLYPVRSARITLGCIILEVKEPISQLESIVLEQGHAVLALELARKQSINEFYYKKKRELFNELLASADQSIILQKAKELSLVMNEPCAVVLFKVSQYSKPQYLETFIQRLTAQIKRDLFSYVQLLFTYHDEVTLIVRLPKSEEKQFRREIQKMSREWQAKSKEAVMCGVGTIYESIYFLKKSYDEAKTAMSYLYSRNQSGIIDYSEIGVNRLFINQDQDEIRRFMLEVFKPLTTQNAINNNLAETLMTYMMLNRSAVKTAQAVHIHINTLYQRLKKIEELLEISFQNHEDMLKVQLACYLKQSYSHL